MAGGFWLGLGLFTFTWNWLCRLFSGIDSSVFPRGESQQSEWRAAEHPRLCAVNMERILPIRGFFPSHPTFTMIIMPWSRLPDWPGSHCECSNYHTSFGSSIVSSPETDYLSSRNQKCSLESSTQPFFVSVGSIPQTTAPRIDNRYKLMMSQPAVSKSNIINIINTSVSRENPRFRHNGPAIADSS